MRHNPALIDLSKGASLQTLVENRTAYTLQRCELNVFETYATSYEVPLTFNDFVITSMLRGKKVMHLLDKKEFYYLPGETVIVPPANLMRIDFPEATDVNPTQCIALAIDNDQIKQTIRYLNEYFPKADQQHKWSLNYDEFHFHNNEEITFLINKIIRICAEGSREKDVLADLTLKELLVRIMQTQNLQVMDGAKHAASNNPLAYALGYIKNNLGEKINIAHLSNKACMSKATFYRLFKRELGISPNDYILTERIKRAKQLLSKPGSKIAAISYELGFSDANYFSRVFKKLEGITPGGYQLQRDQVQTSGYS
ncbi:AraC family transcriptional regulator [Pedobacter sp. AW31-3R]|uniref:helix-turn-helix transcriptional regulator n=1 Tax=Pedobacter sp. AW31-3R TaxID=3445781 RepID=UPI003FA02698